MPYLIYLFIFASAMILGSGLYRKLEHKPISDINSEENIARNIKRPPLFKFLVFLLPLNRIIVRRLGRENLEDRLMGANVRLLPEDFIALKEVLLILSIGLIFTLKDLFLNRELLWILIFGGVGYIGPDFWLKSRLRRRQRAIIKTLPDVVDLLALCVNAGLDFSVAVKWVVEKSKPDALTEELGLFLMETKVGKSRKQALMDIAKRINLPEVNSFTRTLIQAERMGTPIEAALDILAEETREFRFRRAERLALSAPIKMLFPLIFFVMPVVIIVVGGPILLQFLESGLPQVK